MGKMASDQEHQLGVFIQGRMLFIEDFCAKNALDPVRSLGEIKSEMLRRAGAPERVQFLESRLFVGSLLPTTVLPDWVDQVFLEAMTRVLGGVGAKAYTTSSQVSCIPFEAGRFNAHRQSETVFRTLYASKSPEAWLQTTFPVLYRQCYGAEAGKTLQVEQVATARFRIAMDNRALAKASQLDCSTVIGYLFGSLERLDAARPLVTHPECSVDPNRPAELCVFEVSWG
jgi:hypothetical protein